jgi:hypothetical protein
MENFEIPIKSDAIIKSYHRVYDEYLDKYLQETRELPKEEQLEHLKNINVMIKFMDDSLTYIQELIDEVEERPSKKQLDFLRRYNDDLKKYIRALGGNPSVVSFA